MRVPARKLSVLCSPIHVRLLTPRFRSSLLQTKGPQASIAVSTQYNVSSTGRFQSPISMSAESTQSQACCNTPAVVTKGYSPKGDYIQVDGLKTCWSKLPSTACPFLTQCQMLRVPKMPNKVSLSFMTSSGSSIKRSRARIFSPIRMRSIRIRSSCLTSLRAARQIFPGILHRTKSTKRSSVSSSVTKPLRQRHCHGSQR